MKSLNIVPQVNTTKPHSIQQAKNLLEDRDTFATVLLVLVLDLWGYECLFDKEDPERGPWHPTTFKSMLEEHFGVNLPKCNLDKLMAAITIKTTDMFFKNVDRFIVLANILSGDEFDPNTFEKADSVECAWAITEALLLEPPTQEEPETFCEEIRRYIGFVLRDEGYITPPDILKIAIDGDFKEHVRYNFSDDPEMFAGIYAIQKEKTEEVEKVLHSSLLELHRQLGLLQLNEGSTAELEKNIAEMLKLNQPEEKTGPENVIRS